MTRSLFILTMAAVLVILGGCPLFFDSTQDIDPTDHGEGLTDIEIDESLPVLDPAGDEADFRQAFMKSFDLETSGGIAARGVRPVLTAVSKPPAARATVPVDLEALEFSTTEGSFADYPEPGLVTSYTVELADADEGVYLITSTTAYPESSEMEEYVEQYYVRDLDPAGTWDEADPIVAPDGDTWVEDRTHRERMEVVFRDGSVRYETIVTMIHPDDADRAGFAPFTVASEDVDLMTFPAFAYPVEDEEAVYSSIVVYTHVRNTDHNYWFWEGVESQDILGVRYYTEHFVDGGTQYKGTMAAYEKTISNLETVAGDLVPQLEGIFIGNINTVLAESVIRKEVLFDVDAGAVDPAALDQNTIMRTHVVNVTDDVDFQIRLLNDDVARLLTWEGEPYHIPTAGADEIEAENPEEYAVLVRTEMPNPDGEDLAGIVTSEVGDSDLAALYVALEIGAFELAIDPGLDIQGTIDASGEIWEFDGGQGYTVPDDPVHDVTTEGTVEAWVYINEHTNWGGIVHKGVKADFSDEAYSLQFWGNKGNVAFAVAEQSPSYKYATAKSKMRLNTGEWYYLVGTWDADKLRVYINGEEDGNANNTLRSKTAYVSDGPLVIGSQLADTEAQVLKGYYGTKGRINGVKISDTAKSAAEILQFYDEHKDLTVNW